MEGKGTYFFKNGDVYIGEWMHGMRNGQGVLSFSEGKNIKVIFFKIKLTVKALCRIVMENIRRKLG